MNDTHYALKAANTAGVSLDEHELALINRHTLRALSPDDLFAFKVTACDNEVDRDFEAFDPQALKELAGLFIGKTVIMDHTPRAGNQCARIYAAEVICEKGKRTSYGGEYARLEVRCYMLRSEGAGEQIARIEAGILKEVSVGCAVSTIACSVCGKAPGECGHSRGEVYDGKCCFHWLWDPTDAYELSFVAVPAQPAAGVTKDYDDFRAELRELTRLLKEMKAAMNTDGKGPPGKSEPPRNIPDAETEELISSAKALLEKMKGDKNE